VHVVALTRARLHDQGLGSYREARGAGREMPREEIAALLAELTGEADAYTFRLRLGPTFPWLVAREADPVRAHALVQRLRERGLGAVACDLAEAVPWSAPPGALAMSLEPDHVAFGPGLRVPYEALRVVVLATLDQEHSREEIEKIRVRTGRYAKEVPVSGYRRETTRTRAAHLFLGARQRSVRLVQGGLRLATAAATGTDTDGLSATGDPAIPPARTSLELFERAVDALLARAPHAIRDARLVDGRRARSHFSMHQGGRERLTSNLRETDVAARLLALAWLEQQIDPEGA
jgi:hypothetical protein